ncbi:MAG: hypothetical protein AMXMBFR4_06850 [Candidatus Hydrogenedentota bacterium]
MGVTLTAAIDVLPFFGDRKGFPLRGGVPKSISQKLEQIEATDMTVRIRRRLRNPQENNGAIAREAAESGRLLLQQMEESRVRADNKLRTGRD